MASPPFEADSTWYESRADRPPLETLNREIETETCIVGAGLRLYLARDSQSKREAVVIEARRVGLGASGRHGGFCGPGWACEGEKIENVSDWKRQRRFQSFLEGFQMVRDVLNRQMLQ